MKPKNIDEYIATCDPEVREMLIKVRKLIQRLAPDATEAMTYGIPTFKLNGNLVHFAAFKNHLGFYPDPSAIIAFEDKLKEYNCATGTIRFPFSKPIPYDLIEEIVRYRVKHNRSHHAE